MTLAKANILRGDVTAMLGSFCIAVPTGLLTLVAARTNSAGHLLAMQWTSAVAKALIRSISVELVTTTAFTTPQEVGIEAFVARTYTGAHTGGTAITLTGNNQKLSSAPGATSLFADARVSGAGALTAVTATLDNVPFASISDWSGAVGKTIAKQVLYDGKTQIDQNGLPLFSPIVLGQNEGLVFANAVLMGAAGVCRAQFFVEWDEVTP